MEHPENSAEYAGLQVNSGVEQPSIINPYLKRNRFRRRELSAAEMVEGIVKGDITILSQAVTLVESVNPDHQAKAQAKIMINRIVKNNYYTPYATLQRCNTRKNVVPLP